MKKIIFLFIVLTLSITLYAQSAENILKKLGYNSKNLGAKQLNRIGFKLYEQKNYKDAALIFELATQKDNSYIFPHHNYACALSLYYAQTGQSIDMSSLVKHLKRTIELDEKRIEKILTDKDLDPVRNKTEFIKFILSGKNFEGTLVQPCPGDACPEFYYYFYPNGTVGLSYDYPNLMDGSYTYPAEDIKGRYAFINNQIIIYFPNLKDYYMTIDYYKMVYTDMSEVNISNFIWWDYPDYFKSKFKTQSLER